MTAIERSWWIVLDKREDQSHDVADFRHIADQLAENVDEAEIVEVVSAERFRDRVSDLEAEIAELQSSRDMWRELHDKSTGYGAS